MTTFVLIVAVPATVTLKNIQHGVDLQAQRAESAIVLHVIVKEENNGNSFDGRSRALHVLPGGYY